MFVGSGSTGSRVVNANAHSHHNSPSPLAASSAFGVEEASYSTPYNHSRTTTSNISPYASQPHQYSTERPLPPPPPTYDRSQGSHDEYVVRVRPRSVAPVDEEGFLTTHRALNANQVTMITLGSTFGTGLLVSSGVALYEGGPLGILIAYSFVGFICYCVMTSLCEMATYLPHKKGFVGFVSRYVHPAIGFALGWTYLCQFLIVPASHINTAATVLEYSGYTVGESGNPVGQPNPVPTAVWRFIFTVLVVATNFLGIRGFGRLEFWLSSFKILVLIALIIFGLVVDLGGARLTNGEQRDVIGFRWWTPPAGPFGHAPMGASGSLNAFLGWWATMVRVLFAYEGIELIGVVVGEAKNPRITVPKAIKQTYRLVFTLYILTAIIIGLIVRSDDPAFSSEDPILSRDNQQSPFVIAANRLAAKGLVPVISAVIIIFALSGATSNIYTASRLLYGMTLDHQAPQILRKVTAGGRPILALAVTSVWSFLSYIGQAEATSDDAYAYFLDLTSTAGAVAWICILIAHIRFRGALRAQMHHLDTLRYTSPMFPYGTWFSLVATTIFTIFKGQESYVKRGIPGIIVAYFLVVFFIVLAIFWRWYRKDEAHATPLDRIDLVEGRREIELEEESYEIRKARQIRRPWYRRLMSEKD